jgi:hypothetical protein
VLSCEGQLSIPSLQRTTPADGHDRTHYLKIQYSNPTTFVNDKITGDATRLGKLGAALAIGEGQSEGWHFDRGDNDDTYSVVFVYGIGGWNNAERQGFLVIPQLNMEIEVKVGESESLSGRSRVSREERSREDELGREWEWSRVRRSENSSGVRARVESRIGYH